MENKIKIVTLLEATLKLTRDIPEDFTLNYRRELDGREVESSHIVCNLNLKDFNNHSLLSKFIEQSIDDFEFRKELSK